MKIRILQCDPVDPLAEDQVHRIRHQTGDLVIEYIQLVDAARRPEKWDQTILCSSTAVDPQLAAAFSEPVLVLSPKPCGAIPSWQIRRGLIEPWNGEWLVKMISQLVHQGQPLDRSQTLDFVKVKKERKISAELDHLLKGVKTKDYPSAVWLFIQDRQNDAMEQDAEEPPFPVACYWMKQKADMNVACLIYPPMRLTDKAPGEKQIIS